MDLLDMITEIDVDDVLNPEVDRLHQIDAQWAKESARKLTHLCIVIRLAQEGIVGEYTSNEVHDHAVTEDDEGRRMIAEIDHVVSKAMTARVRLAKELFPEVDDMFVWECLTNEDLCPTEHAKWELAAVQEAERDY